MANITKLAALALVTTSMGSAVPALAAPITIGTPGGGNCYPFMCNDSGTNVGQSIEYQQVYDGALFPSGGYNITSLTFYFASAFGGSNVTLHGDYVVSLGYTTAAPNGLSSTLASNESSSLTLKFSGDLGGQSGDFTIDPPSFDYDNSLGNLLLDIVVSNQENVPNGSGNGYNQADHSGTQTSRAYCITGQGCTSDSTGLVTTFNAAVPEPMTLTVFGMGLLGLGLRRRRQPK
jgi:hypothetical protein